ncbi:MAG TPA: recombinase family protein [Pseudomonadota bacterium]|nr:recombinase family protein [Pseudomonadota bacterium]
MLIRGRGLKYFMTMGDSAPAAIGYIRVSTDEQASEGISLSVQQDRIVSYCQQLGLNLLGIYRDEWTGKELARPGLQAALLRMVETGALLLSVSLCRISRSVGDWHHLLESYFGRNAKYRFLAFDIAGVDSKTAAGETLIYFRAVLAQGEVSQTSERTAHAMRALKAQGVACGGLPYGKEYSDKLDASGRRVVVENPAKLEAVARIRELHAQGLGIQTIANLLTAEGRPPPRKSWSCDAVRRILTREGLYSRKHWDRSNAIRDPDAVTRRIAELRAQNLSYQEIGKRLTAEKLMPEVGSKWYPQTVKDRWHCASTYDQGKTLELAVGYRRANYSLRQIARELTLRGLTPKRGGAWHPNHIRELLLLAQIPSYASEASTPAPKAPDGRGGKKAL